MARMDLFPEVFFDEPRKKKKADIEALTSPFMRIPRLPVEAARDLIDLGFSQTYELVGRSPETLFAEILKRRPETPADRLAAFRLAVYVAENPADLDRNKLYPAAWL